MYETCLNFYLICYKRVYKQTYNLSLFVSLVYITLLFWGERGGGGLEDCNPRNPPSFNHSTMVNVTYPSSLLVKYTLLPLLEDFSDVP